MPNLPSSKRIKEKMNMFKNVIVKNPGNSFVNGLTTSDLGKPILEKLFEQHEHYVEALKNVVLK